MRNTADVTGGKSIAVWSHDIHGRKRESRTPHETDKCNNDYYYNYFVYYTRNVSQPCPIHTARPARHNNGAGGAGGHPVISCETSVNLSIAFISHALRSLIFYSARDVLTLISTWWGRVGNWGVLVQGHLAIGGWWPQNFRGRNLRIWPL
jgi:hypothetical protein